MTHLFDFNYYNPTRLVFGQNALADLGKLVPRNAKILLIYGSGSIKRNGAYDEVKSALTEYEVVEFSGVEPNPSAETLDRAVELVRHKGLDFILAVGGGSVIDGAKYVACAACYPGDGWDIVSGKHVVTQALPVGVVITLAATGSESNGGSVITNASKRQKKAFFSELIRPQFAILKPQLLMSLPDRQLENGLVDAFVHVCEQYLTYPVGALVQDGCAEAVMRALKEMSYCFDQRRTIEWMQNLMWAANQALCGTLGAGVPQDWATHRIAVELTALYDIDHGRTLSILQPGLLRETVDAKRDKLEQLGRRVFDLANPSAEDSIAAIEGMYRHLNMPLSLKEAGVSDPDAARRIMDALRSHGLAAFGGHAKIDEKMTENIIRRAIPARAPE